MLEDMLKAIFGPVLAELLLLRGEVRSLRQLVARWVLPVPGELRVTLTLDEETGIMKATATLPPLPSPMPTGLKSVDSQNYYVQDDTGAEVFRASYPVDGSVLDAEPVPVDLDRTYTAFCSYQDAANPPNVSSAVSQTFTARDDVPPDAPGPFGAIRFTE